MSTFIWGRVFVRAAPGRTVFITVPKKVLPRAVDRNRARRRVRAALAGVAQQTGLVRIYPTRAVLTTPFAVLVADLMRALNLTR